MEAEGIDQSELARSLRITSSSVNQWLNLGRIPRFERLQEIASLLNVDVYWLFTGREPPGKPIEIPLVGHVYAGDEFDPIEVPTKGEELEMVPADFGPSPIAVEVRGDSMLEVYRPGDRLMGPRHTDKEIVAHCINRDCFVKTSSGRGYIKKLVRGTKTGVYTLRSYNKDYKDHTNVELEWAAPVRWVRRVGT